MPNDKLLIVDGTSILIDYYHKSTTKEMQSWKKGELSEDIAFKTILKSIDGTYINAIQGFIKILFEMLDKQNPSHLIVVWGNFRETGFRNAIHKEYKTHCLEIENPLEEQLNNIKKILTKMNIVQYASHKYESLDLAGSIAKYFEDKIEIDILTRNPISLQLSNFSNIWIKTNKADEYANDLSIDISNYPKGYLKYNKELVQAILGIEYNQVVDYRAILGNSKNSIPGVKGIGKETISPLLKHFGSIDNLYEEIESLCDFELNDLWQDLKDNLNLKRNPLNLLLKSKQNVLISKRLVTIKCDIFETLFKTNKIDLDALKINIDKEKTLLELHKIDLTPLNKNDILDINLPLSSMLRTFNPFILSPSDENYVGSSINDITIDTPNIESKVFSTSLPIPNTSNEPNECSLEENVITNIEINTSNKNVTNDYTSTIDTTKVYEDINESLNLILDTLPQDTPLKSLLGDNLSLEDNYTNKVSNFKKTINLELIKSIRINEYHCHSCNKTFSIVDDVPNYCPLCGETC